MNDAGEPPPVPGESRAIELLRIVGRETPEISAGFTNRVVARARAQRAVAVPLRALGGFVAALATALAAVARSAGRAGHGP